MARKTLLTESEIRQFMKLANLPVGGQGRLEEFRGVEETNEEEGIGVDQGIADVPVEDDLGPGPDVVDDVDVEDEFGADGTEEDLNAEELVTRIAHDLEALAKLADVDVDVQDDEGTGEEAPDVGVEEPMGELPGEEEEVELGGMMEEETETSEEDIVNEVARRVAARLGERNHKDAMISNLAERILNRITSTKYLDICFTRSYNIKVAIGHFCI